MHLVGGMSQSGPSGKPDFGVLIIGFDRVFLAEAALAAEHAGESQRLRLMPTS